MVWLSFQAVGVVPVAPHGDEELPDEINFFIM
jgi:hypothetical protein